MTIYTPILDRSKPLYLAIADAITTDVESGTLPHGARLPPQRNLAWRIGVTLGTVTRAYKEVELRGLLNGEVGRGSYIKSNQRAAAIPALSSDVVGIIDLSHAIPPPVITADEFDAAISNVMRESRRLDLLDYAPPEGFAHHRELGRRWLQLSGINVEPSDVVVTAGAHVALMTVLGAISEPREAVMAEQMNYALLGATLRNAYLEALPIEMDAEGLLPDAFERAAKSGQSRILYLVPTLHNPTTHTMKRHRREAIVSIARKYNITIIEDDIFRLLDNRTQPSTFYALAPERTFHITGLSKVLAPGLRIGFIATPRGQDRVLKSHIRSAASRSIGVTGEMARYWFETGMAQTIMTRIRNEFEARRNVFIEVFKACNFRCEQASPFAWLELPDGWTAGRFSTVLGARGVKVTPGNAFQLGPQTSSRFIRVCFGHPKHVFQIRRAFEAIHALMQERNEDDFTPVA
jgi:DNA-binding transcriptional MocR family regulator